MKLDRAIKKMITSIKTFFFFYLFLQTRACPLQVVTAARAGSAREVLTCQNR